MTESWQLYDEQGRPLANKGGNKDNIFTKGLLHGAAHVWIWRKLNDTTEILLQKRAPTKRTWPNKYDISAAGHIDLGEAPITAAIRETREEIGLDIIDTDLKLIAVERRKIIAPNDAIENEFCWVYILELKEARDLKPLDTEVASLTWKKLSEFESEVLNENESSYVPQGSIYFSNLISAINSVGR